MKHISSLPKCDTCAYRRLNFNNDFCKLYGTKIPDMFFYYCENHINVSKSCQCGYAADKNGICTGCRLIKLKK